ncbi:MAG: hypothetical protein ACRDRL_20390 [Sciscionella sp.]
MTAVGSCLSPATRGRRTIEDTLGAVLARMRQINETLSGEDRRAVDRLLREVALGVSETAPEAPTGRTVGRPRTPRLTTGPAA